MFLSAGAFAVLAGIVFTILIRMLPSEQTKMQANAN
jgi:hypothetical protein